MTMRANARLAGAMFLAYIATGLFQMAVFSDLTSMSAGASEALARLAAHPAAARTNALLTLLTGFEAIALGAALYALTRSVDADIARIAFACRVAEGVVNATSAGHAMTTLSAAMAAVASSGADKGVATAIGAQLLRGSGTFIVSALSFSVGSTLFAWLFLRARTIPHWLARLGVFASLLLVVALPLQSFGIGQGTAGVLIWMPMLVFEVALALLLLFRGVSAPEQRSVSA